MASARMLKPIPGPALACATADEMIRPYLEEQLTMSEARQLEAHLSACAGCAAALERRKMLLGFMGQSMAARKVSASFTEAATDRLARAVKEPGLQPQFVERPTPSAGPGDETGDPAALPSVAGREADGAAPAGGLALRFSAAPWWGVSVALHVLIIMLLGLITMSIGAKQNEEQIVVLTRLEKAADLKALATEPAKARLRDVFARPQDTPATDPNATNASDIVVPPDILAQAELGDHFETINLDRPDTHSAFGNPEARMFHSVSGSADVEGGGGMGGSSLLDDLIGAGGSASPGSGGGWGGGTGTGIGVGIGSGHGSFGQRGGGGRRLMIMRHGGSKATESAVDAGLEWLARHQEKEGFWTTAKYLDNPQYRYGGSTSMSAKYDPGMAGFGTLAFLGAGHSLKIGKYKKNVQDAVRWMLAQQGPDGDFTFKVKPCHAAVTYYCHCIATLACAEALAMNGGKDWGEGEGTYGEAQGKGLGLRAAVERGVELILKWQRENSTGGWTYYGPTVCDVTVSGWAVMALKSAKIAGIPVPAESLKKASEAVAKCTVIDKSKGDYGMAHTGYLNAHSHAFNSKGYAITAAAMVIQEFTGSDRQEAGIDAAAATITQDEALPAWIFRPETPQTDHQNLYYWYYGSLGCFQAGGDVWKKWNEKMKAALVPNQRKDVLRDGSPQDVDGSWNPDDVWGAWGGRVYSTSLAILSLEVYYRYLPLYK